MSGSFFSKRQIDISVAEPFQGELSEDWLTMVVSAGMEVALSEDELAQVSLLVTGDATLRELNLEYRGLDEVTDVLSFSADHAGHWAGDEAERNDRYAKKGGSEDMPFVFPPGELPVLGEIAISYPQARRQAQERNEPEERELALLIVHGVLHLVGHDHVDPEETEQMQAKERTALAAVFPVGVHCG